MYRDREQREFARRLRNNPTPAEKRLWRLIRAEQLGNKFRRQVAIGPFVVDFACLSKKLIVELDGPQHGEEEASRHDGNRDDYLVRQGYRVMRFWNWQLDEDIQSVVEQIKTALSEK